MVMGDGCRLSVRGWSEDLENPEHHGAVRCPDSGSTGHRDMECNIWFFGFEGGVDISSIYGLCRNECYRGLRFI